MFIRSLVLAVLLTSTAASQETSISLSRVDTLIDGEIPYNQPITFYFRIVNLSSHTVEGSANGFRIYSPDGAAWHPWYSLDTLICDPFPCPPDTTYYAEYLDEGLPAPYTWAPGPGNPGIYDAANTYLVVTSVDGMGADTIGFAGFTQAPNADGLFPGLVADSAWMIRIDHVDSVYAGKTICIDSSFFPAVGTWLWANDTLIVPDWDGPHCFVIGDCCRGNRGNINGDDGGIDIADLTSLVGFMFGGDPVTALPCRMELNVDGDPGEDINIADLTYLVAYMFRGGPEPPACP